MKKFSKIFLMLIVLILSMSVFLVACAPDAKTDLEIYDDIISDSVATNGFTLKSDVYMKADTERTNLIGYYHEEVVVAGTNATVTVKELRLPLAGEVSSPLAPVQTTISDYKGEAVVCDFSIANLDEGYIIIRTEGFITVEGVPIDIAKLMDRDISGVSNMNVTIIVNVELKVIESYTITYEQANTFTVEQYNITK